MSRAVYTRPAAVADIEYYTLFIAEQSEDAAERFYSAVFETIDAIAEQPRTGRRREFKNSAITDIWSRQVKGFRNYLIFYRVPADGPLWILRVLHGAMDLDSAFERRTV